MTDMAAIERPIIAITMGDAAGIGPEIIAKALQSEQIFAVCRPVVVGDDTIMQKAVKLMISESKLCPIQEVNDAKGHYGDIDLLDLHNLDEREVPVGRLCKACGKAAIEYITTAAELALKGEVNAIVTAPINKEATRLAGCGELGHMELLAKLTGVKEYATMLVSGPLRVVHLTTHYSLRDAMNFITKERILTILKLTWESFRTWGFERPHIAVAAVNPHGGEGGILGEEEIQEIRPAVQAAQESGINASGPYPADSIFIRAIKGEFDAVLAMYHDQGHIPIKAYGFDKSVSVALGFPFIRTSVDHGTAFDIAGKGIASAESMIEAIKVAVSLSTQRRL
jgi:4-hydroxythreonine-4-phosphate dehydrogenase